MVDSPFTIEDRIPKAVSQVKVPVHSERLQRRKLFNGEACALHVKADGLMIGVDVVELSQGIDDSGDRNVVAAPAISFEDALHAAGVARPDRRIDQRSFETFAPVTRGNSRTSSPSVCFPLSTTIRCRL